MNEKENKIFFKDLPKVLQKEFADNFNHFCETLRTENINGKYYIVIDELTQLNTNMIQPNELRIGNWAKRNEYNFKIIALNEDNLVAEREDGARYFGAIHAFVPIPLTEELIEKQGWYKFDSYYNNGEIKICKNEDWWHLYISDVIHRNIIAVDIKYLHELQNAYFIATKNELEIKL